MSFSHVDLILNLNENYIIAVAITFTEDIRMILLIRFYLFFMGITYLLIGVWAILDSYLLVNTDFTSSFMSAVGLSVTSDIGYSEIAGLYGGLNLGIGSVCIIGIFKEDIGIFGIKLLTLLTGSIASGRIISSLLPNMPTFYNSFFIFEVCAVIIGLWLLNFLNKSKSNY
jgi:hypothetical protein